MTEPFYSKASLTRFLLLAALLVTVLTCALYLARPSFVVPLEHRTTDLLMALGPPKPPPSSTVVVDIDEQSLARYGRWPWPRPLLARLLEKVHELGAAAVGLDIILAEADQTITWSEHGTGGEISHELRAPAPPAAPPENDRILAQRLATGRTVLGYEFLFERAGKGTPPCQLHPPSVVWISSSDARKERFFVAHDVVCNLPIFTAAAQRSGFLNATPDGDGILRRVPMLIKFGDRLYPSLELATLMQFEGSGQIDIVRRGGSDALTLRVGKRRVVVDSQGNMTIRFHPAPGKTTSVSAEALLTGAVSPHALRNKIVVLGSSAAGLEPTYQTAGGTIRSHVEVHAQVLDNLVSGLQIVRSSNFLLWEVLVGGVAAAGTALAVAWYGIAASAALSLALCAGIWLGMGLLFQGGGYLFSPLLPTVLVVGNYATLSIAKAWKLQLIAGRVADRALVLLKESEKNLSSIIQAVPDIIFSLDRSLRLLFISEAVTKYGGRPQALQGRRILPFIRKGDRGAFVQSAGETFRGGAGDVEFAAVRLNKREVWLDAHLVPLRDDSGEVVALLGVARDITDRKGFEKALAEKQRQLEELNASLEERIANAVQELREKDQILILQGRQAAMGEMIGNIAHQWRQPLNTLGLVVQELLITYGRSDFTRQSLEESVHKAMEVIMHMSKTIDDFRNYFITDKQKKLFHVGEAVQKTLSLIEPTLRGAGIEVEVTCAENCAVRGYPNEYAQVLLNILLNSRDAFANCGTGVKPRIEITIWMEHEHCVVTVADNAGGIAEKVLPKIFDPYFTTKGPDKGTGIGLYMAKTIIEKNMGGRLTARNVGKGAEFRIEV